MVVGGSQRIRKCPPKRVVQSPHLSPAPRASTLQGRVGLRIDVVHESSGAAAAAAAAARPAAVALGGVAGAGASEPQKRREGSSLDSDGFEGVVLAPAPGIAAPSGDRTAVGALAGAMAGLCA